MHQPDATVLGRAMTVYLRQGAASFLALCDACKADEGVQTRMQVKKANGKLSLEVTGG